MSPKSLRWKYRALRLVITVGCASSLQLTGCLNNPTRSDLASEAGKAALIAEEDISQQKIDEAAKLAASESSPQRGKVVLSGGETPDQAENSKVVQTAGEVEETPPKKSFWSFLTPKPKKPAVKDPFADQPELKAQAKAQAKPPAKGDPKADHKPETPQGAPGKARLASSSAAVPDAKGSEKDAFSPENWFEKELANQPAPSWAPVGENKIFTRQPGPFDKVSPFDKANDWADKPVAATQKPDEAPWNPQRSDAVKPAAREEADNWTTADTFTGRQSVLSATPVGTADSMNSLAARQQKLRIQALMSEAHTCALRGELHAAYRCALLAEKVAEEGRVTFAPGEETPQEYARSLAAKLWRTSNASEESYLAASESVGRATAPAAARPESTVTNKGPQSNVVANSPFPNGAFATWQPLKEKAGDQQTVAGNASGLTPAHLEQSPSAASGLTMAAAAGKSPLLQQRPSPVADVLPEIRPWPNERAIHNSTPPQQFSGSTAMSSPSPENSLQLPEADGDSRPQNPSSNHKVQFAIAHEVQEEQSPALLDPFPSSGSANLNDRSGSRAGPRQFAAATENHQRPVLLAPPVPAERTSQAAAESTLTWEQLSRTHKGEQKVKTAETGWSWKTTWSILGLIAAGLCTAAGIRYSRRQSEQAPTNGPAGQPTHGESINPAVAPTLELAGDPATGSDEPEIQPLQFKRAA